MDPHNCYFEYLIIHSEYLIIPFDRHSYNGDSHKILKMVFVRYVLLKDELILKTVAIFVKKAGLTLFDMGGMMPPPPPKMFLTTVLKRVGGGS